MVMGIVGVVLSNTCGLIRVVGIVFVRFCWFGIVAASMFERLMMVIIKTNEVLICVRRDFLFISYFLTFFIFSLFLQFRN